MRRVGDSMPFEASGGTRDGMYYAFTWGRVRFIVTATESTGAPIAELPNRYANPAAEYFNHSTRQYQWLEGELKLAAEKRARGD